MKIYTEPCSPSKKSKDDKSREDVNNDKKIFKSPLKSRNETVIPQTPPTNTFTFSPVKSPIDERVISFYSSPKSGAVRSLFSSTKVSIQY